jgi:hypothetical protein
MPKPLPLTVYGPVTPLSPAVRVGGALTNAEVTILDDGNPIGTATATRPGDLWVGLTSQPKEGHKITATQKNPDGTSDPSPFPVPVTGVPNPLPVPVILSDLNTCMVDILAGALVPGATVVTTIVGQPFGSSKPAQGADWVGINPTKPIGQGAVAEVRQEAVIGGVTRVSDTAKSLPIPSFSPGARLLPQAVLGPLTQCDTSRTFLKVTPGAALAIENEGQTESWINPAETYNGHDAPPLRTGKAVVTQSMPRCERQGDPVTLPVGPAGLPPAPTVAQEVCPDAPRLIVSNLQEGGVLHIYRRVATGPSTFTQTLAGERGIGRTTEPVDLPPSLSLTDPAGTVSLFLTQSRCAGESPGTVVTVATAAGPFGAPQITEPLMDCCDAIPITGAHPSATVTAIDAVTGKAISDPYGVNQSAFPIIPWFPLTAGQKVLVRQEGCHANGDSKVVRVKDLPNPIPVPKVVEPVRPHAPWVKVTGVLPCARLHLLVNGTLRPGVTHALSDTAVITVGGDPLAENDRVFVIQTICKASSNIEGPGATVTRGHLKVSVSPAQVARGTSVPVTVTAVDADTGTPVAAQVLLNGANVGTAGTPFSYSPKAGDPNPAGNAREPVAYFDASFTINLVDPSWTLFLQAGPGMAFLDTLKINIDQITWTVTPDWNAALAKTVTVTPSPAAATGSAIIPVPTGAVKTVTVTIAGKASTAGGYLNGFVIPAQSFTIAGDTRKVAFHGPDEKIGWLLEVKYVTDQASYIVFNIVATFAGINP